MGRDYIKDDKGQNVRGETGRLFASDSGHHGPTKADVYEEGQFSALGDCHKTDAHYDPSKGEFKK